MRRSHRRGHQFPPQVSKEELLERTRQTLTDKGVDNVSQAKYTTIIASEVVGFSEPIFSSLQPEIKFRNDPAWRHTYSLVLNFLRENGMSVTLDAIDIELQGKRFSLPDESEESEFLEKMKKKAFSQRDFNEFDELMRIPNKLKRKTFSAKVAEFTGKYKTRKTRNSPSRTTNRSTMGYQRNEPVQRTQQAPEKARTSFTADQSSNSRIQPRKQPIQQQNEQRQPQYGKTKQEEQFTAPKKQQFNEAIRQQNSMKPTQRTQIPAKEPIMETKPAQPVSQRRDIWDPVPMAEPTRRQENSFDEDIFDVEEEEDLFEEKEDNHVDNMVSDDIDVMSDYSDDDIPEVGQAAKPVVEQRKPAVSGWDAPPMDDDFQDISYGSDVIEDAVKDNQDNSFEGSASFDDIDFSLDDD